MDDKIPFLLNHASSFWYGLAAFVIFAFVIAKFGLGPIVRAIDARDRKIKEQLDEAEETAAKAKALQDKLDSELAGAEARIADFDEKIRTLQRMKRALTGLTAACAGQGSVSECPILEALDPGRKVRP